jgi:hypothetical protein
LETNFTNKNKNKNTKALIIESSSQDENEPSIEINLEPTDLEGELIEDEPIYQNEEVSWNKPEYKKLWSYIPEKLKNALMQNQNWMKDFMFSCVNARIKKEACIFVTPKDLKTPPTKLDNGEYDFGVPIYNSIFNKLPDSTKQTYLTLYSEKDGIKNYNLLINTMNKLVEREVNFNPYV